MSTPKQTPTKAVAAGLASAVLVAVTAYFSGGNDLTDTNGLVAAVLSGVAGYLVTYFAPSNKPKAARGEHGAVDLVYVLVAVLLVLVIASLLFGWPVGKDHVGKHGNDWEIHPVGRVA